MQRKKCGERERKEIEMKKTYKLEELDCANCAAKMENKIALLDGVNECRVSFMTGKMTMEIEQEKESEILKQAKQIIHKLEPEVIVTEL